MNLQILYRFILKWGRILFCLLLIFLAVRFFMRPSYSYGMHKKCADMLMLTRFNKFYRNPLDATWTACRWKGRIALFEMANTVGGDTVDAHPTNSLMPRALVARNDDDINVVGFVNERVGKHYVGGMLFVVLVDPKDVQVMGVVVIKDWKEKPTEAQIQAEYPHLIEELKKRHD